MAKPEFDLVVIGGGSGGLVVAAGGATLGAKVALIEKHKMGGDCLWYGCVPSKTLIKSARIAHQMRHADRWSIPAADPKIELAAVMERVSGVIAQIQPLDSPERFRGLGVDVILGAGRFIAHDTVEVDGRRLTARHFVIATGSRPAVLPIPGLDSVPYLTNETVFDLRQNVPHLIVVGAGPIGCELAQAFRRLGSEVEVVDIAPAILPKEDPDLAEVVFRKMRDEGIRFHLGMSIASALGTRGEVRIVLKARDDTISTLQGTHLLLAAGRKANVEDLGLDAAGVKVDKGRIVVDGRLRTTNPDVYVAGDVAGGFQFTHVAENHAGVVLRQTLFRLKWTKPSSVVPWCTYTDPELARVGLSETEAQQRNIAHQVYRFPFEEVDRARAEGETEGFAKLVTDPKGRLLGAGIVGAHAGELITECVLAITQGLKAGDLSAAIHAYPTLASIVRRAADQRQKQALTPSSKTWIKRIFRLRGS